MDREMYFSVLHRCVFSALGLLLLTGCTSTATTNTARTAREQLLLSSAVDQSLRKVDFAPLQGQKVFVEEKYLECVDKPYIIGSVRHRVLRSGAGLVSDAKDADVVLEVRSGGVGTDSSESFVGIPEITLPGMLTLPEVRVAERKSQYGYARLGMVLYDQKTGQVLGDGGIALAETDNRNSYVMGIGPFQNGSLLDEVDMGVNTVPRNRQPRIPMTVAFASPKVSPVPPEGDVQFASESREFKE
ncbi:MAG TPA: hypothetical protein DCG12_16960 [Planctomycetaceae bacterium]|nr:hypothetical protein [Planctomycetaceae bacterium]